MTRIEMEGLHKLIKMAESKGMSYAIRGSKMYVPDKENYKVYFEVLEMNGTCQVMKHTNDENVK